MAKKSIANKSTNTYEDQVRMNNLNRETGKIQRYDQKTKGMAVKQEIQRMNRAKHGIMFTCFSIRGRIFGRKKKGKK